jgi:hypothetical protein
MIKQVPLNKEYNSVLPLNDGDTSVFCDGYTLDFWRPDGESVVKSSEVDIYSVYGGAGWEVISGSSVEIPGGLFILLYVSRTDKDSTTHYYMSLWRDQYNKDNIQLNQIVEAPNNVSCVSLSRDGSQFTARVIHSGNISTYGFSRYGLVIYDVYEEVASAVMDSAGLGAELDVEYEVF